MFNAPVRFEENKNELIIKTESLNLEIDLANQELYKVLERHATLLVDTMPKEKKWSNKVMALISNMILKGDVPDIVSISRKLAVSKRNLQEKLKVEESSFRNLLEAIRKQMAIDNLARQDVRLCEVAFMLGYSDQSAFNHAFKRWTGQTPKPILKNSIRAKSTFDLCMKFQQSTSPDFTGDGSQPIPTLEEFVEQKEF